MILKLRKKLTAIYTISMWIILTIIIGISIFINENQLIEISKNIFQSQIDSIIYKLQSEHNITLTWLSQQEALNNLIIYIEENNTPFFFKGSWKSPTDRHKLIESAKKTALSQNISTSVYPIYAEKKSSTIFSLQGDNKEKYLCNVTVIPSEKGWKNLVVLRYSYKEEKQILLYRISFLIITIAGIIILLITNRIFIGFLLKPLAINQKKQTEFIAAASHELRSPLAVIQANSSAILVDTKKADKFVTGITNECKRMARLIDDMLILANSDTKNWSIQKEKVELDTILIDTYEAFLPLCQKKNQKLSLNLPEYELLPFFGDKIRLQQIFTILLDNAYSYTPVDGKITIKAVNKGNKIIIKFSDTGIGISEEHKKYIFERFYRADSARNEKKHFGLGLSIALELIKLHQGHIICQSEEGFGTTFIIELTSNS